MTKFVYWMCWVTLLYSFLSCPIYSRCKQQRFHSCIVEVCGSHLLLVDTPATWSTPSIRTSSCLSQSGRASPHPGRRYFKTCGPISTSRALCQRRNQSCCRSARECSVCVCMCARGEENAGGRWMREARGGGERSRKPSGCSHWIFTSAKYTFN